MELSIVSMGRRHLDGCGRVVDGLELFARYRFSGVAASQLLGAAMDEGRCDLRVAVDRRDDVTGFAWLVPRGGFDRSGYLRLIAVGSGHRGAGVGRRLVEALEETHLRHGGIMLLASADNTGARRFYERLGYRQVGLLPGYVVPDLDELIFFKSSARV
jgi:ribosomal protein S18 acetylase RimI-like enzyme